MGLEKDEGPGHLSFFLLSLFLSFFLSEMSTEENLLKKASD
jgi:hypothetical protein